MIRSEISGLFLSEEISLVCTKYRYIHRFKSVGLRKRDRPGVSNAPGGLVCDSNGYFGLTFANRLTGDRLTVPSHRSTVLGVAPAHLPALRACALGVTSARRYSRKNG